METPAGERPRVRTSRAERWPPARSDHRSHEPALCTNFYMTHCDHAALLEGGAVARLFCQESTMTTATMTNTLSLDRYRLLGRSGLRVSPLALGAMTFGTDWGWGADRDETRRIFDAYLDRGGNF